MIQYIKVRVVIYY